MNNFAFNKFIPNFSWLVAPTAPTVFNFFDMLKQFFFCAIGRNFVDLVSYCFVVTNQNLNVFFKKFVGNLG